MSSFRRWQALFGARVPHPVDTLLLLGDGGCGKTTFQRALRLNEDKDSIDDLIRETREAIERQWNSAAICQWLLELATADGAKERLTQSEWWREQRPTLDGTRFIALDDNDVSIEQLESALDSSVWHVVQSARSILRKNGAAAVSYAALTGLPHVRTLGIETHGTAAHVESLWRSTFEVWDFAGQIEFFPIHSIADGDGGGITVILFDVSVVTFDEALMEKEARRWFDFVCSRHWLTNDRAHVLLLLTHVDCVVGSSSRRVAQFKAIVERLAGTAPFADKFVLLGGGARTIDYRDESNVEAIKTLLIHNARKNRWTTLSDNRFEQMKCETSELMRDVRVAVEQAAMTDRRVMQRDEFAAWLRQIVLASPRVQPLLDEWRRDAEERVLTSTCDSLLLALERTGAALSLDSGSRVLLKPVGWMTARLGRLFDPTCAHFDARGVLQVVGGREKIDPELALLLDVLVAQKIGEWIDNEQQSSFRVRGFRFNFSYD